MVRSTGTYQITEVAEEQGPCVCPVPSPPKRPVLRIDQELAERYADAHAAVSRLEGAGTMGPSPYRILYGFVRNEAVVSFQIEETLATLKDVVAFEAAHEISRPADVEELCNDVEDVMVCRRKKLPLERPRALRRPRPGRFPKSARNSSDCCSVGRDAVPSANAHSTILTPRSGHHKLHGVMYGCMDAADSSPDA